MIKLTYLYHSGYMIETRSAYLVFDFFVDGAAHQANLNDKEQIKAQVGQGSVWSPFLQTIAKAPKIASRWKMSPINLEQDGVLDCVLLDTNKPCFFFVSHAHKDHFNSSICDFLEQFSQVYLVLSADLINGKVPESKEELLDLNLNCPKLKQVLANQHLEQRITFINPQQKQYIPLANKQDEQVLVAAYGSTDLGVSFVVKIDGHYIFHAGDLNEWHWKDYSSEAEIRAASIAFIKEIQQIRQDFPCLEVVMFPCDPRMGHDFLQGAVRFINTFQCKYLVAMHFWEHSDKVLKEAYLTQRFDDCQKFKSFKLAKFCDYREAKNKSIPWFLVPSVSGDYIELVV